MKIYELDRSFYNKIRMYPTYNKFIFTEKGKQPVIVVDNSVGDFFVEEFSNKTKGLIYLVNDTFLPNDVEEEYSKNKNKYKNYNKIVGNKHDYFLDNNLYDRDFLEFDPKKEYDFTINFGNGAREFSATIENALGLASNYECDLVYNNNLIFSPLGFEFEENYRLIQQYLGKNYFRDKLKERDINDNFGLPYRNIDDSFAIHFKEEKTMKI